MVLINSARTKLVHSAVDLQGGGQEGREIMRAKVEGGEAMIKYKTRAKSMRKWSQTQCHFQDDSLCADNEIKICS